MTGATSTAHDTHLVIVRHIDPAVWRPLLYSFRRYHGLGPELGRSFREPG